VERCFFLESNATPPPLLGVIVDPGRLRFEFTHTETRQQYVGGDDDDDGGAVSTTGALDVVVLPGAPVMMNFVSDVQFEGASAMPGHAIVKVRLASLS
jgi:hypothetical protein